MTSIRKIFSFLILFTSFIFVFAGTSPKDLTKKYLEISSRQLEEGNYSSALESINAALKLSEPEGIPANVALVAVQVYSKLLDEMKTSEDYTLLQEIEAYVNHYPAVADVMVQSKIQELENLRQTKSKEQERSTQTHLANTILISVMAVCAVLLLIVILILFIIKVAVKNQKTQVEQFEETLKLVAGMQQNSQILLGTITDLHQLEGLGSAGYSSWAVNALPAPEFNDEEKEELKLLAIHCEDLGSKIDMVSRRKNNSKNVSEMVYKLSKVLGCNQNTSMAYFCAAMVYDAGFLAVPEEMLSAHELTEQEKEVIRDHVNKTEEYFEFVPARYIKIFEDAARYHHENEDGSGYPNGIGGENIPQIAKLIHVVESYNSLISRRNYKEIRDKESAVEELLAKPELYDAVVVKALDSIV